MGLDINWEIETDDGPEQVAGGSTEPERRRGRRWWLWIIGALVVAGAAALIIRDQLRRVDEKLRADLESTVATETLALRIGDERLYRHIQGDDPEWREQQAEEFEAYEQGESIYRALTGEIFTIEMEGESARVSLSAERNGAPFCVAWVYEYDEGWRHIDTDLYGCETALRLETRHFAILAHQADREAAEHLANTLDGWWEAVCAEVGCPTPPPPFEIQLSATSDARVLWANDGNTLLVPSSTFNAEVDPALTERTLASVLTRYWVEHLLAPYDLSRDRRAWAEYHLWAWVRTGMGDWSPHSSFFATLAEAYGPDTVLALLDELQTADTIGGALELAVGSDTVGDAADDLRSTLTRQLQVESMLRSHIRILTPSVRSLYLDPERDIILDDHSLVRYAAPEHIRVVDLEEAGEILWAEVSWRSRTTLPLIPFDPLYNYDEIQPLTSYVPFRQVDGRWLRTKVIPQDYGEARAHGEGALTIHYRERDEPYVEPLLEHLGAVYPQLAADLGLSELPPVEVVLTPSTQDYLLQRQQTVLAPAADGEPLRLAVLSAHIELCCVNAEDRPLRETISVNSTKLLILSVMNHLVEQGDAHFHMWSAVVWRSRDAYAGDDFTATQLLLQDLALKRGAEARTPEFVDETWQALDEAHNQNPLYQLGANVLLDLLLEQYGDAVLPQLVTSLGGTPSLDEWLNRGLGINAAAVEEAWRARYEQVLENLPEG